MSRVLIIGATGGIGSRLAARLVERGDQAVGLYRRPEQGRLLQARGIVPAAGDLTALGVDDLATHMQGADAVVFAAGASEAGPRIADVVDGRGVVLASAAAAAAGVSRFLLVSAFLDAWRDRRMPPEFEHYMKIKRQADVHLAETDLDWVIVRPGTLTNETGTGRVRLGPVIPYGEVSRDDVAAVLAELVHAPHARRVVLELTSGATPIREAVTRTAVGLAVGSHHDHPARSAA